MCISRKGDKVKDKDGENPKDQRQRREKKEVSAQGGRRTARANINDVRNR